MKHVDVHLQPWQVFYAREEAVERTNRARRRGMVNGSNEIAGLEPREADEIGAVCELATSHYTGYSERFFEDYHPSRPDVGLIEVRGTKKPDGNLRVYAEDVRNATFMVLAVIRELSDAGAIVRLMGWTWSEWAWNYSKDAPYPAHPKKGVCRLYKPISLQPMTTLRKTHNFMEAW